MDGIVFLVLETTDGKRVVFEVVVQACTVAEIGEVHVERVVAKDALCRTPKVSVVTLVVINPIINPVPSRQRRKRESIRAVTIMAFIIIPTRRGLEFCASY